MRDGVKALSCGVIDCVNQLVYIMYSNFETDEVEESTYCTKMKLTILGDPPQSLSDSSYVHHSTLCFEITISIVRLR